MIAVLLMLLAQTPKVSGPECGPLQKSPPFMRSIPPGTWGQLKPTQQGVLIAGDSPWGTLVHAAGPSYSFVSGSFTPWFPYVWPDGPQPTQQLRGPEVARVGAQALAPSLPNAFGLTKPAYLVEVKVNGGHGNDTAREFVLSDLRLLDGTPAFPWQLSDVLASLHARYQSCLQKREFDLDAAAKRASARLAQSARAPRGARVVPPQPDLAGETIYVTWDEPKQSLSVVFSSERTGSRCFARDVRVQPPGCPPGAPCLPGHDETISACARYGVQSGFEFVVDAKGARAASFLPPAYSEQAAIFPSDPW